MRFLLCSKDAAEASVEARRGELSAAKEVEEHKEDLRKTFATHASAAKQFCEAKLAAVRGACSC